MRDLAGKKFNKWSVIKDSGVRTKSRSAMWACKCDCGTERLVNGSHLVHGRSKSCGCSNPRNGTHGMSKTAIYRAYKQMLQRCSNKNHQSYPLYGGRGISVCERWQSFENFYADMGERPKGTSIDRIDGNKGYEPGNCRWATSTEQARNLSSNVVITALGRTAGLYDWSRITGLPSKLIYHRTHVNNWPPEKALTVPPTCRLRTARA